MTLKEVQSLFAQYGRPISIQALSAIELEICQPKIRTAQVLAIIFPELDLNDWSGRAVRKARKSRQSPQNQF